MLKQEVLLFDYEYRKELCREYQVRRKKYGFVAVPCCILFVAGIVALAATKRGYLPWSEYHAFIFLGLAAGLLGFVYTAGMLDAYEQLVENEKYTGRLLFKLERKYEQRLISFHAFTGLRACRVKVDNSACEVSLQIPLHDAGNVMTAANPACSVLLL